MSMLYALLETALDDVTGGMRSTRSSASCRAGEALQATGYQPLQEEVARRGRFMAGFHRDILAPACAAPDDPFQGVSVDLNGIGAWPLLCKSSPCCKSTMANSALAVQACLDSLRVVDAHLLHTFVIP